MEGEYLEVFQTVGNTEELLRNWRRIPLSVPLPLTDAVREVRPQWLASRADRLARYPHLTSMAHEGARVALPLLVKGRVQGAPRAVVRSGAHLHRGRSGAVQRRGSRHRAGVGPGAAVRGRAPGQRAAAGRRRAAPGAVRGHGCLQRRQPGSPRALRGHLHPGGAPPGRLEHPQPAVRGRAEPEDRLRAPCGPGYPGAPVRAADAPAGAAGRRVHGPASHRRASPVSARRLAGAAGHRGSGVSSAPCAPASMSTRSSSCPCGCRGTSSARWPPRATPGAPLHPRGSAPVGGAGEQGVSVHRECPAVPAAAARPGGAAPAHRVRAAADRHRVA